MDSARLLTTGVSRRATIAQRLRLETATWSGGEGDDGAAEVEGRPSTLHFWSDWWELTKIKEKNRLAVQRGAADAVMNSQGFEGVYGLTSETRT
jgi:hypothetical protein